MSTLWLFIGATLWMIQNTFRWSVFLLWLLLYLFIQKLISFWGREFFICPKCRYVCSAGKAVLGRYP